MARPLPDQPNLNHLKNQAKRLLASHRARDPSACAVLRHHARLSSMTDGDILGSPVTLMQAQHALALSYGFSDWVALRDHVEAIPQPGALSLDCLNKSLSRMFRSGRLTALPKRGRDRRALLGLAAASLEDRASSEAEINAQLERFLGPIADPRGLDHLQVRRALIEHGLLHRTFGGATYWPDRPALVRLLGEAPRLPDPAEVLDALEADRLERKRRYGR